MEIRGSRGGKKRRGDVKEYTPEDKVPLAVKRAVKDNNTDSMVYWAERVDVKDFTYQSKEPADIKTKKHSYANSHYSASGEVVVRPCAAIKNKLKPIRRGTFKIQFEDVLDDIGMPDIKINKISFTGISWEGQTA